MLAVNRLAVVITGHVPALVTNVRLGCRCLIVFCHFFLSHGGSGFLPEPAGFEPLFGGFWVEYSTTVHLPLAKFLSVTNALAYYKKFKISTLKSF